MERPAGQKVENFFTELLPFDRLGALSRKIDLSKNDR